MISTLPSFLYISTHRIRLLREHLNILHIPVFYLQQNNIAHQLIYNHCFYKTYLFTSIFILSIPNFFITLFLYFSLVVNSSYNALIKPQSLLFIKCSVYIFHNLNKKIKIIFRWIIRNLKKIYINIL